MFLLRNLIMATGSILDMILNVYTFVVLGRVIISWVSADPHNPIVQFLVQATEPVLRPIRNRIGYVGGIDFAPMILILIVVFLRAFLVQSLYDIARAIS